MRAASVVKQERSIAVTGRVDVVNLAEIYGGLVKLGFRPTTMSGLVSYCVEVAHSAFEQNGYIEKKFEGVLDAYEVLNGLGLMTKSMNKLNARKVALAAGFENLRNEGVDPEYYAPGAYKTLHNNSSVKAPDYDRHKECSDDELVKIAKEAARRVDEEKKMVEDKLAEIKSRADKDGIIRSLPTIESTNNSQEPNFEDRKKMNAEQYQAWKLKQQKRNSTKVEEQDVPRQKTDEELNADAERIARKDRELAFADMSAPKGKAIDG